MSEKKESKSSILSKLVKVNIQWNIVLMAGSLIVAFVYNGLQIEHSVEAINAQKQATELRLFTTLHTMLNDSGSKLPLYEKELNEVIQGKRKTLSTRTRSMFIHTMNNCEYLAWLLNNGFIRIAQAKELWVGPMHQFYAYSEKIFGVQDARESYPELTKLLKEFGRIK